MWPWVSSCFCGLRMHFDLTVRSVDQLIMVCSWYLSVILFLVFMTE